MAHSLVKLRNHSSAVPTFHDISHPPRPALGVWDEMEAMIRQTTLVLSTSSQTKGKGEVRKIIQLVQSTSGQHTLSDAQDKR